MEQEAEDEFEDESEDDTVALSTTLKPLPTSSHPLKRHLDDSDTAAGSQELSQTRQRPGNESVHAQGSSTEPATGPSIIVFSSQKDVSRLERVMWKPSNPPTDSVKKKSEGGTKPVGLKRPKDPNAPKQPVPAYLVYQNEVREAMRAQFPTHTPTELVKEISETWRALPGAERQRYKDEAKIKLDQWTKEVAAYHRTVAAGASCSSSGSLPGESSLGSLETEEEPPTEGQPMPKRRRTGGGLSGGRRSVQVL